MCAIFLIIQDHTMYNISYDAYFLLGYLWGLQINMFLSSTWTQWRFPKCPNYIFLAGLYKSISGQHHNGTCAWVVLLVFWLTHFWLNSRAENSKIISVRLNEFGHMYKPKKATCKWREREFHLHSSYVPHFNLQHPRGNHSYSLAVN